MRAVVQRVKSCSVSSEGTLCGRIGPGLCVLLGVKDGDGPEDVQWLADKVADLRIFEDEDGKMNRSLLDLGGQMLVVSQFTLYGDCRKGRRPSFVKAAPPDEADKLYEGFVTRLRGKGIQVETGVFRTHMVVAIENDGPVTLIVDSPSKAEAPA